MQPPQAFSVTLPVRLVDADDRRCPSCGTPAEMHQPDEDLPDRLIACCPSCGGWALLIAVSDGAHALAVALPDGVTLQSDGGVAIT